MMMMGSIDEAESDSALSNHSTKEQEHALEETKQAAQILLASEHVDEEEEETKQE